jgi:hypothetical protein
MDWRFLLTGEEVMSASATITITIAPDVATITTFSGVVANPTGSMAAGALAANISVAPVGWTGTLALSGPNASSFVLGPPVIIAGTQYAGQLLVGSSPLGPGSYVATVTPSP